MENKKVTSIDKKTDNTIKLRTATPEKRAYPNPEKNISWSEWITFVKLNLSGLIFDL